MATVFTGGFGRAPGRVRIGSPSYFRKGAIGSARQGMADILRSYDRLIKSLNGITPTVLQNALIPVFNRSQVYVPKHTGALMASGHLDVFPSATGVPTASIDYGGPEAPYAAIVHELVHINHAPPTRAKYLQSALEEEFDSMLTSLIVDYSGMFV